MKFIEVANIFEILEQTSSRNDITSILAEFYKKISKEEGEILSYIVLGRISPSFVSKEFNYSEKMLLNLLDGYLRLKAIPLDIKKKRIELGDIGNTVKYFCQECDFQAGDCSIGEIYDVLWNICNIEGSGSVEKKNAVLLDMLQKLTPVESKYFVRIICGQLRFGINFKTLLDVFSFLITRDKSARDDLDRAFGVCADIGYIYSQIAGLNALDALENLKAVNIQPGIPVLPRLVERVGSFEETFDRTGVPALVQSKFDGLRCQIHKYNSKDFECREYIWKKYLSKENSTLFDMGSEDVEVRLFTRNLEDVTDMFPEIVASAKSLTDSSFILDSEVLGFKDGKFLSFQETMQRRRKYGVGTTSKDIPVKAMVFDVLCINGKDLIGVDTVERVDILGRIEMAGNLGLCETKVVSDIDSLMSVYNENVNMGYEGIIVKMERGGYLPGVRNYDWIKLKKSMMNTLVDSVDLVCVGYYFGSGRRSDFGVGAVLGALYNESTDSFEAICKVGTGFSDELLGNIGRQFEGKVVEQGVNVVCPQSLIPDVWVVPEIVFTVEADEITRRLGDENIGGGLSLRFPRLVEWGRDKSANDATRVTELIDMFKMKK